MALNSTAFQVSWLPVEIPSDGTIVGYNVYYALYNTKSKKRQSSGMYNQFFPGDVTQGIIGTASPSQSYQFSVAAVVSVMGQNYNGTIIQSGQNAPIYNAGNTV